MKITARFWHHLKSGHVQRFIHQYRLHGCITLLALLAFIFIWTTYVPQTIAFNFSQTKQCISSPRIFPNLLRHKGQGSFVITRPASFKVGNLAVFASQICAQSVQPPKQSQREIYREQLFGINIFSRQIIVHTGQYAALSTDTSVAKTTPPDAPLSLKISKRDSVFQYALRQGDKQVTCKTDNTSLSCDLTGLELAYAQDYKLALIRLYDGRDVGAAQTITLRTITPITIVSTSIPAGSVREDKPTQILLTTDKKLKDVGSLQFIRKNADGSSSNIPIEHSLQDTTILITFKSELERKTNFELRIQNLLATDSSGLVGKAYSLGFSTSGGPRVKGTTIGVRDVSQDRAIQLIFDQNLLAPQDLANNVIVTANGAIHPITTSISGNRITINPTSAFPLCAKLAITTKGDIKNSYSISGDSAWNFNARVICYTTSTIGTSVKGRPITAYRFGTGDSIIMYLGGMHGSEANSKFIMDEWIADLKRNPDRIPANRSLIVVSGVNPDGLANRSRFNANNVDLNRNFPANDWKSVVTTPQSSQPSPAGGPAPLSEPESRAIARYIQQTAPILVLSYHSKAAIVEANEAGFSVAVASTYAAKARYRAVPKSQSGSVFKYDTTGAMEDWLRDKAGRPAIVVELASGTASEFGRNRDALWYTVGL